MDSKALKILLIEDNLADASLISNILNEYSWQKSHLKHVKKVTEAVDTLTQDSFDAILLDLHLSDSQGIASLNIVRQQAPQPPIIILTATDDLEMAVQSLRQGAQDYLVKGEFEGKILTRSIQYAIERQRNEFNLRSIALMKQMLDKIRNSINLEDILTTTATEIQQFLQCDRVLIYRHESIQSEANTFISQPGDAQLDRYSFEQFINAVNSSMGSSSDLTSVSAIEDTKAIKSQKLQVLLPLVRSYLIVPILLGETADGNDEESILIAKPKENHNYHEQLWGVLIAYNVSQTHKWQDWQIGFLQRLTAQVTVAITQSQLCCQLQTANQKLHQLAILDGLTGIANRRYFDLVLNKEWQRLAREQQPLSLILCDIDFFKAYNDAYGHQKGDRCLQKIARLLSQATRRPADLAARYGGEEFALILPNTNSQGALHIARSIMNQLAKKQIPHQKSGVNDFVTFSIGVTTKIPRPKQSAMTITNIADKLLYQAKAAGRDRLATDSKQIS